MDNLFDLLSPFTWDGLIIFVVVFLFIVLGFFIFLACASGFILWLFGDLIERAIKKDHPEGWPE